MYISRNIYASYAKSSYISDFSKPPRLRTHALHSDRLRHNFPTSWVTMAKLFNFSHLSFLLDKMEIIKWLLFALHIHTNSYQVIQLFLILICLSRLGKLRLGKRHTFEQLHRQQVTCWTMILQEVADAHPSRVKPIMFCILDNVITLIWVHSSPLCNTDWICPPLLPLWKALIQYFPFENYN